MTKKKAITNKGKRRSAAAKSLFAVLVVFTGVYIAAKTVGSVAMSNVSDAVMSFAASVGEGESYPYDTTGQNVSDMKQMGSGLLLIKPDVISVLNFSSAELQNVGCKYSAAAACVNNGRAIVFDRNASKFCVVSKTKLLYSGETKGAILTAAMGKNGFAAVASMSEDAASELTVYDRGMKEYFKWECVSDYIADMSISDNGKNLAVIVLGVKEAEVSSKLWVFEMGAADPIASFEYDGTTLVDVEYTGKKQIVVLGDNLRSVISTDMTRQDEQFSGDELSCFASAENGRQAAVLLPYGDKSTAKLSVYAKDGSKSFENVVDGKAVGTACGSSYAAVLTTDCAYVYDSVGTLTGKIALDETASRIAVTDTAVYIMFNDRIEKYTPSGKNS